MNPEKSILIIEDNDDIRFFYSKILKKNGFKIIEASTSICALNYLTKDTSTKPALIILDLGIPGYGENEFLNRIFKICRTSTHKIPVLISSGWPDAEETAITFGADAFLPKPVVISTFISTIQNLVHKRTSFTPNEVPNMMIPNSIRANNNRNLNFSCCYQL